MPLVLGIAAAFVVAAIVAVVLLSGGDGGGGGGGGKTEKKVVTIGPKTVNVDGRVAFTDTGIDLQKDDEVATTATGQVFPAVPDQTVFATPDGVPNRPDLRIYNVLGNVDHSGLIGKVGAEGSPFAMGSAHKFTTPTPGRFFLGINDTGLENNGGAFSVTVTVTRR